MSKKSKRPGPMVIPLRRPYRDLVLAFVLFGACAVFFYVRASNNDRGLILNGVIEMGPEGADWFYAIMGILSAAMSGAGLWGSWNVAQIQNWHLDLGKTEMTFPGAPLLRSPMVKVPYDRIVAVEMITQGTIPALIIREDDRTHNIPSKWIAEDWTAQQVSDEIISRVRAVHDQSKHALR